MNISEFNDAHKHLNLLWLKNHPVMPSDICCNKCNKSESMSSVVNVFYSCPLSYNYECLNCGDVNYSYFKIDGINGTIDNNTTLEYYRPEYHSPREVVVSGEEGYLYLRHISDDVNYFKVGMVVEWQGVRGVVIRVNSSPQVLVKFEKELNSPKVTSASSKVWSFGTFADEISDLLIVPYMMDEDFVANSDNHKGVDYDAMNKCFENLADAVANDEQRMVQLEAENKELKKQVAALIEVLQNMKYHN